MSRRFTVLLSSAGRRVALLRIFREALHALGLEGQVLASDLSPTAAAFHDADQGLLVPRVTAADYIDRTLALCAGHQVDLVIPLIDPELPVLAVSRHRFEEQGTEVHVSTPEVCAIGGDKIRTHSWLTDAGLPTVAQATADEVLDGLDWSFPALIKPSRGSSSMGVQVVADRTDLRHATRAPTSGSWLVQSIARGIEYTVSVYVDRHGQPRCAVPRQRLETRAGEVSKGVTRRIDAVEELALRAVGSLPGARGAMNLQIFHDTATGELAIIELNPRFGGGYPLAHEAGARYAQWLIEEQLGLPSTIDDQWQDGLAMLRFDDAIFRPVAAIEP